MFQKLGQCLSQSNGSAETCLSRSYGAVHDSVRISLQGLKCYPPEGRDRVFCPSSRLSSHSKCTVLMSFLCPALFL